MSEGPAAGPPGRVPAFAATAPSGTLAMVGCTYCIVGRLNVSLGPTGLTVDLGSGTICVTQQGGNATLEIHGYTVGRAFPGGPAPGSVAYDAANRHLYVANVGVTKGGQSVSVFSLATGNRTRTIRLGGDPGALTYDSRSTRLLVSVLSAAQILAISGADDSVIARINVAVGPDRLASDPRTGDLFVAGYGLGKASEVNVIDTTNLTVVANISVGAGPDDVAYDPADDRVFVANSNSGNVSVIDPNSLKVVASIALAGSLTGIAYDPSDGHIYVANYGYVDMMGSARAAAEVPSGAPLVLLLGAPCGECE